MGKNIGMNRCAPTGIFPKEIRTCIGIYRYLPLKRSVKSKKEEKDNEKQKVKIKRIGGSRFRMRTKNSVKVGRDRKNHCLPGQW
jgi:hypothetical protein